VTPIVPLDDNGIKNLELLSLPQLPEHSVQQIAIINKSLRKDHDYDYDYDKGREEGR
jgi:hypothetical protein